MERSPKSRFVWLLLLPVLFSCGCCNFAALDGNGCRPKAAWRDRLPSLTRPGIDQIRLEAESSDVQLVFERGAYCGYRTKLQRGFSWRIPFGPYRERSYWVPDPKRGGESLCIKMDCWGTTVLPFMTGLFMAGDVEVYDYPGGDCLARQSYMRAGIIPLLAYESSLMPVSGGRPMPGCPNVMLPESLCRVSSSLEGVREAHMGECYRWQNNFFNRPRYERLTSYYFLCGFLAFGQKNERAYLQLAWFPIGLWSLE